jgi:DNA-binding response OmpR family regulator
MVGSVPTNGLTKCSVWWQCRAAGMDDYLSKPINRDLLYATIQKWLEAAQHTEADAGSIFCNNINS